MTKIFWSIKRIIYGQIIFNLFWGYHHFCPGQTVTVSDCEGQEKALGLKFNEFALIIYSTKKMK